MSCGSTACYKILAILAIQTYKEDEQYGMIMNSDIDLSHKRRYLFIPCCFCNLSGVMLQKVMLRGVTESDENDDIVLSNYIVEGTYDSKKFTCTCSVCTEASLFHTGNRQNFKGVIDSVCFLNGIHFVKSDGRKRLQKRKRRGMQRKRVRTHYILIGENTSQRDKRRHRKRCHSLKRYRMFKFRMFLFVILNLRLHINASNTSSGKEGIDGQQTANQESSLKFSFKTKKLLQFYLCDSKKCNGKVDTVLNSKTDHGRINNMEIEKAPFSEDFENALQEGLSPKCFVVTKKFLLCGAFGDDFLDNDESVVGNVSHNNFSENSFADINKNVLLNELSGDISDDIDKNVLHNDLSGDSSVETDEIVLHKNLSGGSSVDIDKNVLHNDLSGDSSLDIDKNVLHKDLSGSSADDIDTIVLHNDLSGDSSVDIDKNVLHSDLSGDSSVDIDKTVLHNDLSGDGSVDIDKNVLHNDLSGDSSVEIHENVLHNDLSEDSSVDIDKNVLHNDLSGDSYVDIDKNVLHNDLSGDSSVEIYENVLHNDLSEDSSVDIDKNVLQSDMSGNSSVNVVLPNLPANSFIKICEKGIIDSSEYFKTSKSGFQNALLESISITISKLFHDSKLDSSNTHHTKAKDNGGSWLETSEIGCIRSNMEMLKILGIFPRFSESPPIFWQEITLYPFRRHTNGDLHQLMCYEVFRLCSFSYARFPADFDVWVTRLAQAGFYCENGRIVCFHCGREFQGTVGSSVENVHHPECNHHEHSRPLHVWTEGLNQDVLAIYYNRYGSLRPYNFEVSGHQVFIDQIDRPHEAIPGSDMGEPEAQRYGEQDSSDTSMGRESGIPVLTEVTMGDSAIEEPARPEYHSEALPTDPSQANRDHGFGDQRHSLPGNLNEVSGAVVSEESQEPQESYQMLTSAASNPMPFYNPAARGSQSQGDDGNENGAVGGAGVTLDLSKASYPLFSSAEARRQTFTSWSVTHSHRPEDLVAAGFFYAGYADCVRCFYCGLGLKYWRPTDIPAYQHARYRPHCVYNRLYKGPDYIARVQQDLQSEEGTTDQLVDGIRLTQGEVTAAAVARPAGVQDAVAPGTGTPLVAAPSVPDLMNSEVAQEALRNGWERNQVQRAVDHIVREFGVHCLEISLLLDVLTNLNMDNPERNQPSPGSLGSADSGINEQPVPPAPAAAAVSENHNDAAQEEANTLHIRAVPTQQPAPPAVEFNELFRSVEREHTLLAERTTCRLCRRRPVSCIYLPCGHVIACQECADNATHCILCSRQIIGTANIFLA